MDDVKEKIRRLLRLAESPNENEAKAALLKARKLMAEYKLAPDDLSASNDNVMKKDTGIYFTKYSTLWRNDLAAVIADNCCCVSYFGHHHCSKTYSIGFFGLEDDLSICIEIFLYANAYLSKKCDEIKKEYSRHTGKYINSLTNAYAFSFVKGLNDAFLKQNKENEEWGLVLKVPEEVLNAVKDFDRVDFGVKEILRDQTIDVLRKEGYQDGCRFQVSKMLK